MKRLRRITVARVMSWKPCPGWPRERVEAIFVGRSSMTPIEFTELEDVPAKDRLWLVLREEVIPARELRLIACWSAERALRRERAAGREPDARSWAAVRVARRYALGRATVAELAAAAAAAATAAATAAAWPPPAAAAAAPAPAAAAWAAAAWAAAAVTAAAVTAEYEKTIRNVRRVLRRLENA